MKGARAVPAGAGSAGQGSRELHTGEILQHLTGDKVHSAAKPPPCSQCSAGERPVLSLKEYRGCFLGRVGHLELRDTREGKFTALRALFSLLPNTTLELQQNCN